MDEHQQMSDSSDTTNSDPTKLPDSSSPIAVKGEDCSLDGSRFAIVKSEDDDVEMEDAAENSFEEVEGEDDCVDDLEARMALRFWTQLAMHTDDYEAAVRPELHALLVAGLFEPNKPDFRLIAELFLPLLESWYANDPILSAKLPGPPQIGVSEALKQLLDGATENEAGRLLAWLLTIDAYLPTTTLHITAELRSQFSLPSAANFSRGLFKYGFRHRLVLKKEAFAYHRPSPQQQIKPLKINLGERCDSKSASSTPIPADIAKFEAVSPIVNGSDDDGRSPSPGCSKAKKPRIRRSSTSKPPLLVKGEMRLDPVVWHSRPSKITGKDLDPRMMIRPRISGRFASHALITKEDVSQAIAIAAKKGGLPALRQSKSKQSQAPPSKSKPSFKATTTSKSKQSFKATTRTSKSKQSSKAIAPSNASAEADDDMAVLLTEFEQLLVTHGGNVTWLWYKNDPPLAEPLFEHLYGTPIAGHLSAFAHELYHQLPTELNTVPEFFPQCDEVMVKLGPKKVAVVAVDFVAITKDLDLRELKPAYLSIILLHTNLFWPTDFERHVASKRLKDLLRARRQEIGPCTDFAHYERFGSTPDRVPFILQPHESFSALGPDNQPKVLPPGYELPPFLTLPADLRSGQFSERCKETGCGLFSLSVGAVLGISKVFGKVKNNSKRAKSNFATIPTGRLNLDEYTRIDGGFLRQVCKSKSIADDAKLAALREEYCPANNPVPPDPDDDFTTDEHMLNWLLNEGKEGAKTYFPHVVLPSESYIHDEQKNFDFDFKNLTSAGKYLGLGCRASRESHHQTILALAANWHSTWTACLPGFNGAIFNHQGHLLVFIVERHSKHLMYEIVEQNCAPKFVGKKKQFCPVTLDHGHVKGVKVGWARMKPGSILSIGIGACFMVVSLSPAIFEQWQTLTAEGLLYFYRELEMCSCDYESESGESAKELDLLDGNIVKARERMLSFGDYSPLQLPEFACKLHPSVHIVSDKQWLEHQRLWHQPAAVLEKLGYDQ